MVAPRVSIVIPAYNAEQTISQCIESVAMQNYSNIECIVINDGSTDQTDLICKGLQEKYSWIKYLRIENMGVSHARNVGINEATGEYLIFVDSDDLLLEDSIITRVEMMNHSALVIGEYCYDDIANRVFLNVSSPETDIECFIEDLLWERRYSYQGFIWNKMFSLRLIQEKKLRFRENICYNEDRLFVFEYVMNCCEIVFINTCIYCYIQGDTSAMASVRNNSYNHKQLSELTAFQEMLSVAPSSRIKNAIRYACFLSCIRLLRRIPKTDDWEEDRKEVELLKKKCLVEYLLKAWRLSDFLNKLRMIKKTVLDH